MTAFFKIDVASRYTIWTQFGWDRNTPHGDHYQHLSEGPQTGDGLLLDWEVRFILVVAITCLSVCRGMRRKTGHRARISVSMAYRLIRIIPSFSVMWPARMALHRTVQLLVSAITELYGNVLIVL